MAAYEPADLQERELHPAVTPLDRSAQVRSRSHWWVWLLVLALAAAGFWYFRGRNAAQQGNAVAPSPNGPNAGRGRSPMNMAVPVVVATAQKGDLPVYFNGLGNVTAFNTVTVRSRVDGQIVKINFTEGQFVKEGDSLIEIDPRPFQVQLAQAQGQLAKDEAARKDAQVNLDRFQQLFEAGVIPKQQLDTQNASVSQFDGAIQTDKANIENAKLQIAYAHIASPISGRVGLRLVDIGNMVHANDTNGLVVITQLQPISVLFSLPQDQLPEVMAKMHSGAPLKVEAYDRDNTDKLATGKLLTIDNQIDTATGTYKLKAIFDNSKNELFPNQFVNVHLLVDTKKNVVLVPTTAILRGPQGSYVFGVSSDNTVKIRKVTVAQANGNVTGVTTGLGPGDVVVTDGQDKLQDGSKVVPNQAAPSVPGSNSASAPLSSPFVSPGGGPAR